MPHDIDPDEHYQQGESVIWEFTVTEDGSPYPVDGGSVSWMLLNDAHDTAADAILDGDTDGVSVGFASDGSDGRIDVRIERTGDDTVPTDDLSGYYHHRIIVDDAVSGRQIWGGLFPINDA